MTLTARHAVGTLSAVAALPSLILPSTATASPTSSGSDLLQRRVDSILAEHPGGMQTSENEIS